MRYMNITRMTKLFEENPEIKSNRARRNLIQQTAEWLTQEEAGRALGLWLRCRGEG